MKILQKGKLKNGTDIQIEEWHENYNFIPYGSTLASYPLSKISLDGQFAPKANERYRIDFNFKSEEETKQAFDNLLTGKNDLADYKENISDLRYKDCI